MHSSTRSAQLPRLVRIEPTKGLGRLGLGELWEYKDLLWFHTLKEITSKYRQMALGPLWIILQPIVNMVLFSFVFGTIAKLPSEGVPYPIFVYTALLPWTLFQNACTFSSNSLVQQMPVISKVYFPRLIVPIASTLSWVVDFMISFAFLLLIMLFYGFVPGWKVLFLPLYLMLTVAFALAIGFCSAGLSVKYRDVNFVITYGLRSFMYLTPVAYSATLVPDQWLWAYKLNPLYWVIEGFRWALIDTAAAPSREMALPVALTACMLALGIYLFRRSERTVVDLL
jgi:lipopolysaccharide transport system permease protein